MLKEKEISIYREKLRPLIEDVMKRFESKVKRNEKVDKEIKKLRKLKQESKKGE